MLESLQVFVHWLSWKTSRPPMEIFSVIAWSTVFIVMNWAKLKTMQGMLLVSIGVLIQLISSADTLFARLRIYKVYMVLRKALIKDCISASILTIGCLILHGIVPDSRAPGAVLHVTAFLTWVISGVQPNPMISLGLWGGGRNQMTKNQMLLRVAAQGVGTLFAFLLFSLYFSFKFQGAGHSVLLFSCTRFFTMTSAGTAAFTCFASALYIWRRESQLGILKQSPSTQAKTD